MEFCSTVSIYPNEKLLVNALSRNGYKVVKLRDFLKEQNIDKKYWSNKVDCYHLSKYICVDGPLIDKIEFNECLMECLKESKKDPDYKKFSKWEKQVFGTYKQYIPYWKRHFSSIADCYSVSKIFWRILYHKLVRPIKQHRRVSSDRWIEILLDQDNKEFIL